MLFMFFSMLYKTKEIIIYGLIWCAENPPFSLPMPCQKKRRKKIEKTTHEKARNEKATLSLRA